MIITIDGPSSSGKSTLAKLISDHFSIIHIDSGSIYRTITHLAIENKLIKDKEVQLEKLMKCLNDNIITFKRNDINKFQICVNNEFIESKIRTTIISNNVSSVATIKEIRDYVLKLQREIAINKSIVMDGRDIGSVVFFATFFSAVFFVVGFFEEIIFLVDFFEDFSTFSSSAFFVGIT